MIIRPEELSESFFNMGTEASVISKCHSTGFESMDSCMKLAKGYMSIITGYPSSGKSEFLDAILVNMTVMESNWNIIYYSPENHPVEQHMGKLAEKFIGKPIGDMKDADKMMAYEWVCDHFTWLYPEVPKLETLLALCQHEVETRRVDAIVFDPWNEILHEKNGNMIHEYLSEALMKIRRFARQYSLHIFIVAHPKSPTADSKGVYPFPDLYSISDGAMWRNKADYGWIAHRGDLSKHEVAIHVQKLKYKWMGKVQAPVYYDYDFTSGRFKEKHQKSFILPIRDDSF